MKSVRLISETATALVAVATLSLGLAQPGIAAPAVPPTVALVNCNVGAWWNTSVAARPYVYNPTYNTGEIRCVLGQGNNSSAVIALQHAMVKCNGAAITVDGVFGPKTRDALLALQRRLGIAADGVYGPQTNQAMLWPFHASRSRSSSYACYNPA